MPITSDRLLTLLDEAETHRRAFISLKTEIREKCYQELSNPLAQQLIQLIELMHPTPECDQMLRERLNFEKNGQKNISEKLRMRRKRRLTAEVEQRHLGTERSEEETIKELQEHFNIQPSTAPVQTVGLTNHPHTGLPGADRLARANAKADSVVPVGDLDFLNTALEEGTDE